MRVWTVANQKGGVGKTTTVVTLGGLLAGDGANTLLLDLDPHGSLTAYMGLDPDTVTGGVYGLFAAFVEGQTINPVRLIKKTRFEHLYLMPASTAMVTLDRQLGQQGGMGLVVSKAIEQLEGRFQRIIIDCPPILGILMVNALVSCQHLIIPVQPDFLAIKGLERTLKTLRMIGQSRRTELCYSILPTMFDANARSALAGLRVLREAHTSKLAKAVIPVDLLFREASRTGAPLSHVIPNARGVLAYRDLLQSLNENEEA